MACVNYFRKGEKYMVLSHSCPRFSVPSSLVVAFTVFSLVLFANLAPLLVYADSNTISEKNNAKLNTPSSALEDFKQSVHRFVLSNGLRVVFVRRSTAPIFTGQIWVKVGGVNEVPGKTGASHMLEHMAFKGTTTIGTKDYVKEKPLLDHLEQLVSSLDALQAGDSRSSPEEIDQLRTEISATQKSLGDLWIDNEFSSIYQRSGASGLNAATSKDYTFYTVSLPISAFELWCSMESDRILHPIFRQFYKERDVVLEERRMRVEDNPGGMLYEHLLASSYLNHPNRLPVIGWYADIKFLRTSDVIALHKRYYRPDNVVLSIVGDLNEQQIEPLLEQYFGRIPKPKGIVPGVTIVEGEQKGPREVTVEYEAEPQLMIGYHKPTYPDPDDSYFAVLHSLLSDGRSSILYRQLVQEEKIAAAIETSEAPGELYPSLFTVGAYPARGVELIALRDRIQQIFDRLKDQSFSSEALAAAKQRVRVGFLSGLSTADGIASIIGKSELLWNDWQVILDAYGKMEQTKESDIKRLADKYLKVRNRTTAYLKRPNVAKALGADAESTEGK